ncbi:hypothetical protein C8R47DRAFT_1158711 [Mycena vitilis]|nr:hypothetical protein C8R47DRAFT_1158711 [Mycena vitilis]
MSLRMGKERGECQREKEKEAWRSRSWWMGCRWRWFGRRRRKRRSIHHGMQRISTQKGTTTPITRTNTAPAPPARRPWTTSSGTARPIGSPPASPSPPRRTWHRPRPRARATRRRTTTTPRARRSSPPCGTRTRTPRRTRRRARPPRRARPRAPCRLRCASFPRRARARARACSWWRAGRSMSTRGMRMRTGTRRRSTTLGGCPASAGGGRPAHRPRRRSMSTSTTPGRTSTRTRTMRTRGSTRIRTARRPRLRGRPSRPSHPRRHQRTRTRSCLGRIGREGTGAGWGSRVGGSRRLCSRRGMRMLRMGWSRGRARGR